MPDIFIHDPVDLGFQIRKRRKQQGISANDLCKEAGISRDTLNRLEKGRDVTTTTLFQVLGALQVCMNLGLPDFPSLEDAPRFFLESLLDDGK